MRTNGPTDPTAPNAPLKISKTVAGSFADTSHYFEFKVKATQHLLLTTASIYKAYVVTSGGGVVTSITSNGAIAGTDSSDSAGPYFVFNSGTERTIKLKHDQQLVFVNTQVGTTYSAIETGVASYTPSVTITTSGSAVGPTSAGKGANLSTGTQYVGEATNSAAFTNTHDATTPTGVIINNLPYIGLIALAAGALALYLAAKLRCRTRYAMAVLQQ
jgi:hypothetical protein